jgi:hypothetical protein
MNQVSPSLLALLEAFRPVFRQEVFHMFLQIAPAWIACLGKRTISRVWETTGQAELRNHAAAFRFFSQAVWNWDDLARILVVKLVATFVPGVRVWIAVDDTLCHKRGAKVAYGGIFLDAVLSSRKHKNFRFGNNWVKLTLVVQLSFREDRYFALPILWRIYEKKNPQNPTTHRSKSRLAVEMISLLADWVSPRKVVVLGDCAYIGEPLLKNRSENVDVIGPIRWDAALTAPLEEDAPRNRKKGERLQTPRAFLDDRRRKARRSEFVFPQGKKELEYKVMENVCWYQAAGSETLRVVLVRDPTGEWRDEALVCTDADLDVASIVSGYCRRWAIEVSFLDAKQHLGFHDPQVWCEASVRRAAPMSWFLSSLVILWYAEHGHELPLARRERPWYRTKVEPTFRDMLWTCRLDLWRGWLGEKSADEAEFEAKCHWLVEYLSTAA